MKRSARIAIFYICVALLCAAIIGTSMYLRSQFPKPDVDRYAHGIGKETVKTFFPIVRDLVGTNQDGAEVKLSDLRGKVWLVAEFFAVCPHCAVRNGAELGEIARSFANDPNFHIVCISVDPEADNVAHLKDYAEALGAESSRWWFMNAGSNDEVHEYLEKELKFMGIRERSDPLEIEAQGRYSHDLGFLLVNKDFEVVGKWPLPEARSDEARQRDPDLYQRLKNDLFARIREELAK